MAKNLPVDHEAVLRFKKSQEENVPMPSLAGKDWAELIPAAGRQNT